MKQVLLINFLLKIYFKKTERNFLFLPIYSVRHKEGGIEDGERS